MHDNRPASDIAPPPRLRMESISKQFGGVQALRDVSLTAHAGEVHAVCGENGAGKSTLMKILAGAITDYEGTIFLDGRTVRFHGPRHAEDAGIRIIHQELNLVPDLSAAANIFLGRERKRWLGFRDDRAMIADARALLERVGAPVDPRRPIRGQRIGDQQMVEIARALAGKASILIMDEPTSALSDAEVERLFRLIRELKSSGTTILYISHKMNEIFSLADRVTILRDGRFVDSVPRYAVSPADVVRSMVGREIAHLQLHPAPPTEQPLLEVDGLSLPRPHGTSRPALSDITFTLHKGEVLGVAGLLGAGRTELLEALFGASTEQPGGSIRLDGRPLHLRSPSTAIGAGIALVTEDRKLLGLFPQLLVRDNISLSRLNRLATRLGLVRRTAERETVSQAIARLGIKTASQNLRITSLSGGNQQKCVIARSLLTDPRVLLLDEPTRGIDVGAKADLYALMRRLASEGLGILVTSSELPELLAVCDRILVLCEGRLTASLPRGEASEELIMHHATAFLDRATSA